MATTLLALGLPYLAGGVTINYVMWKVHVAKVEKECERENLNLPWELGRDADFWIASAVTFVATLGLVVAAGVFHLFGFSISLSSTSLALLGFVAGGTFSLMLWTHNWLRRADWLEVWGPPIVFLVVLYLLSGGSLSHVHITHPNSLEWKRIVPISFTTHQIDYRVLYADDPWDCERAAPIAQTMVSDLYNPVIPITHLNAMRVDDLYRYLADDRIAYKWHTLTAPGGDNFAFNNHDSYAPGSLPNEEIAKTKQIASNWKPGNCP